MIPDDNAEGQFLRDVLTWRAYAGPEAETAVFTLLAAVVNDGPYQAPSKAARRIAAYLASLPEES